MECKGDKCPFFNEEKDFHSSFHECGFDETGFKKKEEKRCPLPDEVDELVKLVFRLQKS